MRSQKNVVVLHSFVTSFFKFCLPFPCPEIVRSQETGHYGSTRIPFVQWSVFKKMFIASRICLFLMVIFMVILGA